MIELQASLKLLRNCSPAAAGKLEQAARQDGVTSQ